MRIAMLGVALGSGSRSTNIARTLGMIDAAAGSDPSPDLIVVPAGCDRTCRADQAQAPAMREMYWASLSAKAREWGVYLAAGQERLIDGQGCEVAIIIDADGDEILVHSANGDGARVSVRRTLIGRLGMCFESQCVGFEPVISDEGPAPQVIIVPADPVDYAKVASPADDACNMLAAETNSFVCVVRPASGPGDQGCVTCSDVSRLAGRMELAGGVVVSADVPGEG